MLPSAQRVSSTEQTVGAAAQGRCRGPVLLTQRTLTAMCWQMFSVFVEFLFIIYHSMVF